MERTTPYSCDFVYDTLQVYNYKLHLLIHMELTRQKQKSSKKYYDIIENKI